MERTVNPLTNPNEAQQQAVAAFNFAIGALAATYHVNQDQLSTRVGTACDEAILDLLGGEAVV